MKRSYYFNYVEENLGVLAYRVNVRGKLNILDLHNHSENFYLLFLNCLFGWNFTNANAAKHNVEAIDLIDHTNKVICQVSATNTKQKVESALSKKLIQQYPGYTFKFICISKNGGDLKKETFINPHGIKFNPKKDIIDNKALLNYLLGLGVPAQEKVYKFIKDELGNVVDVVKLDSNLATVINILAKEDFTSPSAVTIDSFEIERKIDHNNLEKTKPIIEQFATYCQRVDKQFTILDAQGANKSLTVLQAIKKCYVEQFTANSKDNQDLLFLKVNDCVRDKILNSANYHSIPLDELEFCVSALVVNAFIRCKIFENPKGYSYASA